MACGVQRFLAGAVVVVGLGALAACSGGSFFAERAPWRREAEVRCISSGVLHEGTGVARINAINGPGMCGADYPLRVAVLGEPGALAFSDDFRPPAAIPNQRSVVPPRWPIVEPSDTPPEPRPRPAPQVDSRPLPPPGSQPNSFEPPGEALDIYDFRRPYGAAESVPPETTRPRSVPPARRQTRGQPIEPDSSPYDLSPEPQQSRRALDGGNGMRAPARESHRAAPLGPSRGPRVATTGTVAVTPTATLACPLVTALDQWIATAVQPAAMHWFGEPVVEIRQISAYSCRGMNGNPRANISEHAFGNALDIASFRLADGRRITVKDGWRGSPEEQGFLRDVQGAACDRFTTVLAPGSNAFHYDHMHVDLMQRRNGHRACNPRAVSGEEIAARVRARYAQQGRGSQVTGSVSTRRKGAASRSLPPNSFVAEEQVGHQLPLAVPGEDGED